MYSVTNEQAIISIVLIIFVKSSLLYKLHRLRLTICVRYLWEMALKVDLDISFDNIKDREGIRNKTGEVSSTKGAHTGSIMLRNIAYCAT
jgi:hypothetical protein